MVEVCSDKPYEFPSPGPLLALDDHLCLVQISTTSRYAPSRKAETYQTVFETHFLYHTIQVLTGVSWKILCLLRSRLRFILSSLLNKFKFKVYFSCLI